MKPSRLQSTRQGSCGLLRPSISALPSPIAGAAYPVLFSHPAHYWRSSGGDARAHGASCMGGLHALGACAHRRWRGDCSYQSSAPALAARVPLQARVVPSLFAYLRPGCRSVAVASLHSCSGPFSLHIFPLFIRSFDLHRCAFPVISQPALSLKLALPCRPACLPRQVLSSFIFSPSSSRRCSLLNCFHLPARGLFSGSHIVRQNKRGVEEGQDTRRASPVAEDAVSGS